MPVRDAVPMEPIDTVRRYAEAWRANDLNTVFDLYHDDFVLHYFGESPLAGEHVGKEAAISVLVEATQRSGRRARRRVRSSVRWDHGTASHRRLFVYAWAITRLAVLARRRGPAPHDGHPTRLTELVGRRRGSPCSRRRCLANSVRRFAPVPRSMTVASVACSHGVGGERHDGSATRRRRRRATGSPASTATGGETELVVVSLEQTPLGRPGRRPSGGGHRVRCGRRTDELEAIGAESSTVPGPSAEIQFDERRRHRIPTSSSPSTRGPTTTTAPRDRRRSPNPLPVPRLRHSVGKRTDAQVAVDRQARPPKPLMTTSRSGSCRRCSIPVFAGPGRTARA